MILQEDTTEQLRTATDTAGRFTLSVLQGKSYILEASCIGYSAARRPVGAGSTKFDIGITILAERAIPLDEVVIQGRVPAAVQRGDTTEYSARAFRMNRDASAEDLVTKLPGVTVDNGSVKAQGEDVQQVLVDGRPFFGTDPPLALRNLPSEVVDKVQVFDKLSDQAQLTGFDDGQSVKAMHTVTRSDRRQC